MSPQNVKDPVEAKRDEERIARMTSELQEQIAMRHAMERAAAWDRAMNRAFKGIFSRPRRHDMLQRQMDKEQGTP